MNLARRSGFLAAVAAAAAILCAAPVERAWAQTVTIPDANLRAALESALGKAAGEEITRAEMQGLATFYADNAGIRELTGLEYATNLWGLTLEYNEIEDIGPLASLTQLSSLGLYSNRISDLTPLARLPYLRTLRIGLNRISDLTPLAGLTSLTVLELHENWISDVTPLAGLVNLERLALQENRITDLAPLARLTSLKYLFLHYNRIADITPLRGMTSLINLNLGSNEDLEDLSAVEGMTALERLSLGGSGVRNLAPLAANTGLGSGDLIDLRDAPNLNADAGTTGHLATLRGRGVNVLVNTPLGLDRVVRRVRVTPGVERLTVAWDRLKAEGGFNPTGYRVQWKSGSQRLTIRADPPRHEHVTGLDTTSHVIPDLTPGVEYTVQVRAHGAYGPPSARATGTPLASVRVQGGGGEGDSGVRVTPDVESLAVSWDAVDGAADYLVQWRSGEQGWDPDARQMTAGGPGETRVTIPDLTPGTEYKVRVIAVTESGAQGPPSDEATGIPLRAVVSLLGGGAGAGVGNATAVEGEAAELRVRLDQPSGLPVTVTWRTEDGTAKAGEDYAATTAGRLTIRPGQVEARLRVATLEDRRVEPAETFRVRLMDSASAGPDPGAASATVTIADDDTEPARGRALSAALAGMARWIAADAVETIEERLTGREAVEAQVSLGGRTVPLPGFGPPGPPARSAAPGRSMRTPWPREEETSRPALSTDTLHRSRFNLALGRQDAGAGGSSGFRVWGQGSAGGFGGRPQAGFRTDGDVAAGYVGFDYPMKRDALLGVAVSHGAGDVDYAIDGVTTGAVDLALTTVLPYAHWKPRAGLGVWGLLGAGWGDAKLKDEAGRAETALEMRMAAAGMAQDVKTWREIDVAVKADAFLASLKSHAAEGLPEAGGQVQRLRLRLEGRMRRTTSPVSRLTPSLELGGRWDGGDAETGLGVEVGGGLAYEHETQGLEVEARGRTLLTHRKSLKEWGMNLAGTLDPGPPGQGPWMTFALGWGAQASRVAQMWDAKGVFRARGDADEAAGLSPNRLDLEVGWGLAAPGGAGTLTPWAGLSTAGPETRDWTLGVRMKTGSRMSLSLENGRSKARGYEVMLYGHLDW